MPIRPEQREAAQAIQRTAAHHDGPQARLVAGPGTGKSFTIEERVCWLLGRGVPAERVFVVSFTRASSAELRSRVHRRCAEEGHADGDGVSVSTLHALALRILRRANLLGDYPAEPRILDDWDLRWIFDDEFGKACGVTRTRAEEIRRHWEAFWETGEWNPPNYAVPDPPVTPAESAQFEGFHDARTRLYSCVLPGEMVRQCVDYIAANALDPVELLGIEYLVVDEFQDLNPSDLQFVAALTQAGVNTFVAGDDDQSIYSFRFALPAGIQNFVTDYPGAGDYVLSDCFRCTPVVVQEATRLITAFPLPNRIAKPLASLYEHADPPVAGSVVRLRFRRDDAEARAIAESSQNLIAAGVAPREILVLISDRRTQAPAITRAFEEAGVPFDPPSSDGITGTDAGHLAFAYLRLVCDDTDYVAHRVVLGNRTGVGPQTCDRIATLAIENNINFRALFRDPPPGGVFRGRPLSVIDAARHDVEILAEWTEEDTLEQRGDALRELLEDALGQSASEEWSENTSHLPPGMTLREVREFLGTRTDEQAEEVLAAVYERLGLERPAEGVLPPRVRIMTMHGAKGLSASVVFIPGLEESIFPGPRRRASPGLRLEAARLLYVSISRARAACVLSYAIRRTVHGESQPQSPSPFVPRLGGPFVERDGAGLTPAETAAIARDYGLLF